MKKIGKKEKAVPNKVTTPVKAPDIFQPQETPAEAPIPIELPTPIQVPTEPQKAG